MVVMQTLLNSKYFIYWFIIVFTCVSFANDFCNGKGYIKLLHY
jgi:hypothetical protein